MSFRVAVSRLRVSSHRLEVEKGRWKTPPVPFNNRLCNICQVLDDEFHFLFKCQLLQDAGNKPFVLFCPCKCNSVSIMTLYLGLREHVG